MENFIFLCNEIRDYTCINFKDLESLSIELLPVTGKNTLCNILYRAPNEDMESFENFMQTMLPKT